MTPTLSGEGRPSSPASTNLLPDTFAKLAKMKILVIDDEPANVALLEGAAHSALKKNSGWLSS